MFIINHNRLRMYMYLPPYFPKKNFMVVVVVQVPRGLVLVKSWCW